MSQKLSFAIAFVAYATWYSKVVSGRPTTDNFPAIRQANTDAGDDQTELPRLVVEPPGEEKSHIYEYPDEHDVYDDAYTFNQSLAMEYDNYPDVNESIDNTHHNFPSNDDVQPNLSQSNGDMQPNFNQSGSNNNFDRTKIPNLNDQFSGMAGPDNAELDQSLTVVKRNSGTVSGIPNTLPEPIVNPAHSSEPDVRNSRENSTVAVHSEDGSTSERSEGSTGVNPADSEVAQVPREHAASDTLNCETGQDSGAANDVMGNSGRTQVGEERHQGQDVSTTNQQHPCQRNSQSNVLQSGQRVQIFAHDETVPIRGGTVILPHDTQGGEDQRGGLGRPVVIDRTNVSDHQHTGTGTRAGGLDENLENLRNEAGIAGNSSDDISVSTGSNIVISEPGSNFSRNNEPDVHLIINAPGQEILPGIDNDVGQPAKESDIIDQRHIDVFFNETITDQSKENSDIFSQSAITITRSFTHLDSQTSLVDITPQLQDFQSSVFDGSSRSTTYTESLLSPSSSYATLQSRDYIDSKVSDELTGNSPSQELMTSQVYLTPNVRSEMFATQVLPSEMLTVNLVTPSLAIVPSSHNQAAETRLTKDFIVSRSSILPSSTILSTLSSVIHVAAGTATSMIPSIKNAITDAQSHDDSTTALSSQVEKPTITNNTVITPLPPKIVTSEITSQRGSGGSSYSNKSEMETSSTSPNSPLHNESSSVINETHLQTNQTISPSVEESNRSAERPTSDVTTKSEHSQIPVLSDNMTSSDDLETQTPSSFMELKFAMSWPDFCQNEGSIRDQLVDILQERDDRVEITADQIQLMNTEREHCIKVQPSQLDEISVRMYLINKSHHFDRSLTLVCANILVSCLSVGDSSAIRNKLLAVRIHDENNHELSTSASLKSYDKDEDTSNTFFDPGVTIAVSLAAVGGCYCLGLIILQIIVRHRNREKCVLRLSRSYSVTSSDSIQLSSVNKSRPNSGLFNPGLDLADPLEPSNPLTFIQLSKFCMDENKIYEEYQKIPYRMPRLSVVPAGDEDKNRYANVLPLAQTRVILRQDSHEGGSTYINANYVTGPKNQIQYYIATQAPTEKTTADFWTMVWQQGCKAIVMLSQLEEEGQIKCASYWPELVGKSAAQRHGDFLIELKQKDVHQEYIASRLEINNLREIETREIDHFWYTCWPPVGVPEPISLVKLVLDTRPKYEGSNAPLVVHCSPGTGRTCAFIALDLCMRQFEETRVVDVMRTVYVIRQERAGAIQNKEQYALLYNAINEYATIVVSPVISAASSATTLHALLQS